MGVFKYEMPVEIMRDLEKLESKTDDIFGKMTHDAAEVVYKNVLRNVPSSWRGSNIMRCIRVTKIYKTPSDDGINTKVVIDGYFCPKRDSNDKIPAPLVANAFEYGTSYRSTGDGHFTGRIAKHPFFRKSFKKSEIEKAMLVAQKKYSGGLLDE